ncbi:light-harvesting complex-like protein OHP1, chloroplastic [Rhodamnia argentea]|uniref:Light-harvesting complex-like protein OHP1, chloroplastic n=1 Tax=Rhodamnia argentea TaxID=178133 RepID=A0A8B8Q5T7_9MYRT|nr:light-harvesting complex-like protein OHP1, chloroplastic [Rhodamnia argentea]
MAASFAIHSASSLVPTTRASKSFHGGLHHSQFLTFHSPNQASRKPLSLRVRAAKLPSGVEVPKVEPKFEAPFLGFTTTAEVWNSRACMIGLIGTFIVELIVNKGILQVIGVDVGKGLDLPL